MADLVMKRLGPPPPDGTRLHAILERIDGLDGDPFQTKHGPCLRFVFRPTEERYAGRDVTALTSVELNQYSKLFKLLTAMRGSEITTGESGAAVAGALVGKPFEVTVRHATVDDMVYLRAVDVTPAVD
jgi:hypothetical protein